MHLVHAEDLRCGFGRPGEMVDREQDLEHGVALGFAVLPRHQFGELLGPPGEQPPPRPELARRPAKPSSAHQPAASRARLTAASTAARSSIG